MTKVDQDDEGPNRNDAENSIDALHGIAEAIYWVRDACYSNGIRENKQMARGFDLLASTMKEHVNVVEDVLFPGRRQL